MNLCHLIIHQTVIVYILAVHNAHEYKKISKPSIENLFINCVIRP